MRLLVETNRLGIFLPPAHRPAEKTLADGQPCFRGILFRLLVGGVIAIAANAVRIDATVLSDLSTASAVYGHMTIPRVLVCHERH
jgi:hypothetical protein